MTEFQVPELMDIENIDDHNPVLYMRLEGTAYILTRDGTMVVKRAGVELPDLPAPRFMDPMFVSGFNDMVYPWEVVKDRIEQVIVLSVSGVSDKAFFRCPRLHTVYLDDTVTSLGFKAFAECPALENVIGLRNVKTELRSFEGCEYLPFETQCLLDRIHGVSE